MTSVALSFVLILAAIIAFIVLCYKGLSPIASALICTAIVALADTNGFQVGFFSVFPAVTTGFMAYMLLPFLTGAIFGTLMNVSGCNEKVGRWLVAKAGPRFAPYTLAILTIVLLLGGVMSYVFVVAYLSFGILKAANLPRVVGLTIMSGYMPIGMILLCGATTTQLIPTQFLGTTIYAGLPLGVVMSVVCVIMVTIYVEALIRACRKDGIGWDGLPDQTGESEFAEADLPSILTAILPVVIVVVGCLVLINVVKLDSTVSLVSSQSLAAILILVMNWSRIKGSKLKILTEGAHAALVPLVGSSLVVGFAGVVGETACYNALVNWIGTLNINPYALTVIGTALCCAICADAMGGLSAFFTIMTPHLMASGANLNIVHKLAGAASATFDSLPHNGNINISLQVFGLTHKQGYKHMFIVQCLFPTVYAIIGMIIAIALY
jgi:H+/gluconate symporter-like permease